MDIKQNPFSLYDFLGYFIPGAFLAYTLFFVSSYVIPNPPLSFFVSKINFDKPEIYVPFVIFSYVCGHVLSFLSSITIEQYAIWQFGYPSKFLLGVRNQGYFANIKNDKFINILIRVLVAIAVFPVTFLDIVFGQLLNMRVLYTKSLDPLLVGVINSKVKSVFIKCASINGADVNELIDHDFFRYVDHYALEKAPYHVPKMQNYVALYGFLRTLTLIFCFFFWLLVIHLLGVKQIINSTWAEKNGILLLGLLALIAYVLFMAFAKFYRRYSLESLMALTVVYPQNSETDHL